MDLLPWTDEKREIVAATARSAFPSYNEAYFAATSAFVGMKSMTKTWPGPDDFEAVKSGTDYPSGVDKEAVDGYLRHL